MRIQKSSRLPAMLLAAVAAILTCVTVANATQTITTPNAAFISYSLAAGANSAAITPAASRSVSVMGCCTTSGDEAAGQVTLQHIPSGGMAWTGYEANATQFASGKSATAGTNILEIDATHVVTIQVAGTDTIRIHNGSPSTTLAGNVTLVW
jgi:hypothetical protein